MNVLDILKANYFFAVIRCDSDKEAIDVAKACVKGGIKNIEITYTTPNASKVIEKLSDDFRDQDDIVIGAGTVMDTQIAQAAIEAGAKFLVSPHFDKSIKDIADEVLYFPGCATATEIVNALKAGCQIIKAFPGGILGTKFIKDIHGPIPQAEIMPSGGVDLSNIRDWKQAGACAVGIGSALTKDLKTQGVESVRKMAEAFVKELER